MADRKNPRFFSDMLYIIGGAVLIIVFGILLFHSEHDLPDYLTTSDKQTVPANYVSSESFTRRRNGRSEKTYRITREYTINGETYSYESEERRNSTAPVEVKVYLGKDGSYHSRGRRTLVGDIAIILICLCGVGAGVFVIRLGFLKPKDHFINNSNDQA